MKKIFFLTFIIFSHYFSVSQTIIPRFETLGVNDGLPHSSVYSIYQDQKGFMWFGTANGLSRYDGNRLVSFLFKGVDNNGVANNFVRGNVVEDKSGNIWYCNEGGIYKWYALTEQVVLVWRPDKKEYHNTEFRGIYIDANDVFWILNVGRGILKYEIALNRLTLFEFPAKVDQSNLNQVFFNADISGNLWMKVGNDKSPFIFFDTKKQSFSIKYFKNPPEAIFFDEEQKMTVYKNKIVLDSVGGQKNPEVLNLLQNKVERIIPGFAVKDKDDRWWIATLNNGLMCYEERSGQITFYNPDNLRLKSLPFFITTCLFIDKSYNLWIGTDGGGLARLDLKKPKFFLFPLSEGDHPILKDYFTKCFFEDERGRIWFGTHSSGLNIYDATTGKLVNYQKEVNKRYSLPGNIVSAIFQDREKNMWVGSNEGISIFNEEKNTFTPILLKGMPAFFPGGNSFVFKMIQIANGDILCATHHGLIRIFKNKNGTYTGVRVKKSYLNSAATDIIEMDDNIIYISRPGIGILKIKGAGENFDSLNNFLPGIDLRSISRDQTNPDYLWVGSGIGLIHFNTISHIYKTYDDKNGLADNYVYGSLQDHEGNLWVSTNKGLSFFNLRDKSCENYSHLNGLQSNEFNTQAFYKGRSGFFYFGGIKGFNWFHPVDVNQVKTKPRASITNIEINNIKFIKDSNYISHRTISVPYDKNYFTFQFAALDYTMPGANKVWYILEGWDASAVTTQDMLARYSNLLPGKYTLRVKVSNAEGAWSDEKQLNILISAPFWKTKPFILALIFILLSSVSYLTYGLSRQKLSRKMHLMEKQIAVDAERLRISADMHDEIGSGITHIALLAELMQAQHKNKEGLRSEIKIISTSAHRLVQTMSEIIWALNPHNDTLENLLAYIREQSQQHFEPFDIEFNICFPDEVPLIKLSNEERRNLYLVTKELLNNALKHAEASVISLSFFVNKNQLSFLVKDNGIGIRQKNLRAGTNGIRNLKKRMNDVGGSIEWRDIQQGTEVNYSMPLKSNTTFSTFIGTM